MSLIDTPLSSGVAIVDSKGMPTLQFQLAFQRFLEQLNSEVGALAAAQAANDAAEAANAAAEAAQAAADNADTAASTAQTAAEQAAADASLATSGVSGLTLTATDAGASVTISVSAHTRIYGDGTSVAVSSGNITGLAYSTVYYVFYSDPDRDGGAVTYQASTDPNDAAQTGGTHSIGTVETPAAAGPPVGGYGNLPPGVENWVL